MSWVSVGIAAASIGSSLIGGNSQKKAAQKAAKQQAKLTYFQRQEEMRRQRRQDEYQKGTGVAAVGASNIQMTGSSQRYLKGMDMEAARQMAHARQAAELEKKAIKAGAQGAGDALFAKAAGDALGFAANLYTNNQSTTGAWGSTPGTTSDSFLNKAEAGGAFDGSF
jgi:hypothetical protein